MSDRALRILILPSWYFDAKSSSIAGYLFYELAHDLRHSGIDAQIAYAGYSVRSAHPKRTVYSMEMGVPTWRGEGFIVPKWNTPFLKWWIRKCGNAILYHLQTNFQPDLIHAQGYQAGWLGAYIHNKTGIPYIISEHYSGFLQHRIPPFHTPFIRSSLSQAKIVTAVSPGLCDALKPYADTPIRLVPNYYNPDFFFNISGPKPTDLFQWISVGEPIYTKGLDLLLTAFSQVVQARPKSKFRLILADKIPRQKQLEKMAKELGIGNKIEFPGLLGPPQLADLMRSCHALVSASRYETFGKTILEANACGIPVVASSTAGASYILQSPEQGILCEPHSADSLSSAMLQMVEQYTRYKPEKIQEAVASRFHRSIVLNQWKDLYNQLLT